MNIPANSAIDRLIFGARLRFATRLGQPVLIWNMGKVASTSLARSLQTCIGKTNVFTTHFMDHPGSARSRIIYREMIKSPTREARIISLTRDPISRTVSSFFQNFRNNTGISPADFRDGNDDLLRLFLNRFKHHQTTLTWFDDNFARFLGVNVYDYPFDPAKEFVEISSGRYRILLIRSEAVDEIKQQAVQRFLALQNFELRNTNIGEDKEYAALYRRFREEIQLPESYIDQMLDAQYTRHFYTSAERAEVRRIWLHQQR